MPYPLSSSKGYGGGAGSSGLGYSSIPSTSYLPGFSSVVFGGHNFSSGRSPLYGGSSAGSLGLLGLSSYSMPSLPTYSHVSPYAAASTGYVTYGGYSSAATTGPKSYYSPLPTISEHSSGASSSNRRRGQKTYIPVLPLPTDAGNRPAFYTSAGVKTLYTEDIDVTTPRKTATPSEIARKRSGEGFGTIRRGRTVIRLETKKLKESPYVPQENGEQKETPATTEDAKPKEKESTVQNTTIPLISEPEKPSDTAAAAVTREVAEDTTAPTKDYSQVSKWYEEEIRKPMKKEKNAGDKFREKYMVRSRKSKHAGYRRPTLSDIRAQKAVVMKEIEERLKKLTDATPPGQAVPEEMKVEAEKLEKDKERLARLDKKMARRFSRALKKAVGTGEAESSDDESLCVDRQATVKSGRKLSSVTISADLPALCDGEDGAGSIQSQRLTRKQTKRFFFPQEASSVVQPEIIDTSAYAEPQDLFEKNILAQRQTIKTRATQKKCAVINQRKSSASDLEIPTNVLSDKICDVEAKTLEPPEELSEEGKPPTPPTKSAPGSANTSGKKKKLVKKAGDPPAKRVPGNILQPLVVPPKDSDSILESPTEEEIESSKQSKKNSIGKVNGLVGNAQQGLKSPFLKNNLLGKPKPLVAPPNKLNKQPNKLTNDTTAAATGVGALPGKKIGEVKPKEEKPSSNTSSLNSKTSNDNKALAVKPVAELSSAAAVSSIINAEQTKQMTESVPTVVTVTAPSSQDKKLGGDEKASEAGKPIINETKTTTPPTLKNDKADSEKSDEKLNEGKKVAANEETKNPRGKNVAAEKEKVLPAVAKLKPKLALDNKSTSLDGLKPKLKLDGKSASFDANDDKKAGGADKGAANGKKPLMKQEAPANKKPVAPVAVKMAEKPKDAATTESAKTDKAQVESEKKTSNPPTDGKVPETQSKSANVEISAKGPTPVPKKELAHVDKKENSKPTEENLKPIKKVDEPEKLVKEQVAEVKQQQNNLKKVSPAADNESLAKQDLLPVKVEEKKQEKPKKVEAATSQELAAKLETKSEATQKNVAKTGNKKQEPAIVPKAKLEEKKVESTSPIKDKIEQQKKELAQKENKDEKKVDSATPTPLKGKPEEKKIEPQGEKIEAKTESPSSKAEPQDEKQKAGVKSPPAQQKVVPVPLQLKEKLGIKSPPLSPKLKDTGKKATTDALNPSADKKDLPQQQVSKVVNESKPVPVETKENETTALKEKSLPNGHLSPSPPSSPKGKGAAKPAPPNKQQAQKSPQTNEATQKDGGITKFADSNDVRSAKVENLGCNAEMTTNGPEKGKNDSAPAIPDDLPDNSAQMNKVGNLSTASASENLATVPPQSIEGNSGQKLDSVTITNTVASNEKSSVDNTGNTDATDAIKSKSTEDATAVAEPLHSSARQSLIRKSLKRGSPRHSSESSISSSGSSTSTAKTESGSSTSSTLSAGSSAGSRRAPSPPIEDDSDEDRITLDKICPAKTRPKYRKYEIEDFQFLKVLGKGSFGKVLLAELKGSDSYFAIKCLKKDVVLEDDDVECTMIERKVLLMGSKHPYLCHLFCTFQTESHLFFVMEYLNGGDLMFHIQQSGRFTEERARFYGAEIVSGLKFLHKRGVIYRDLKLDNILLDYEGHIRIADFGMCKLQIYLDRMADTFCGTPDYMAPEIIRGLRYNQCVDWWAFGVLLYEMLIGQSPFSGHDEDELFWSVCNEPVHYPRFLSKESKRLLELLLEKDASKRLGTVGCVHGDVKEQPFFQPIDWERLERRDLEPPFKPKLKHSLDVQYFDTTFTKEAARLTPVDKEILRSMDQTQFEGFSYTNPHTTD